uniref:Uncharacterized protein n=1 Tax=Pipistrellus kuhlii TaxID=59472 RepID=A0A7J7W340_PIPKU|nr:hypothetical protein mPipKuh1_008198 [Pipistrellus kuhlii]
MLDMISIFLNLKRLCLCPKMWSIFENVPCALEKNVYSVALGWNVLKMSINSIWSSESFRIDISLLIFCLDDLSKGDSGVLKAPTIIVLLLISPLMSSSSFFIYLGAPVLGAYIFTRVISSCWIAPFSIMKWPSLSHVMSFTLRSNLSDISIATPAFFSFPFAWKTFFHPFTLSLCASFFLRWVSCRQQIHGSYFLIQSDTLCLLIGAFSPFTFKVIIDGYLFDAIFILYPCVPSLLSISLILQ